MAAPPATLSPLTRDDIRRVVEALIRAQLKRRFGAASLGWLWSEPWNEATALDSEDVGLDSLGLVACCARVAGFFGLAAQGLDDYLLNERHLGGWIDIIHGARHVLREIEFETSGTTGEPKRVIHSASMLWEEAAIPALSPGRGKVLSMVPECHAFGFLFSVLAPRIGERETVVSSAAGMVGRLTRDSSIDLVIATPALFDDERLISLLNRIEGTRPLTVITSGSALTRGHWQRLSEKGRRHVIEIYGATETLGIGWRRDADRFALLPHRSWGQVQGGEGPSVIARDGSALPLQDVICRYGAGFELGPRLDGKINRAGCLIDMPAVQRLLDEAASGQRLNCILSAVNEGRQLLMQVKPADDQDKDEIDRRVREVLSALPPEARPSRIEFR
ncbi:MAG: AMP-binding protein [Pseudomonadota bacterium]